MGGDWWTVQCDNCTATMGQFHDPDEAIAAWNTRAAIAAMKAKEQASAHSPQSSETVEREARQVLSWVQGQHYLKEHSRLSTRSIPLNAMENLATAAIAAYEAKGEAPPNVG